MQSLNETASKECSKILTDAIHKIKSTVKKNDGKQKVITQQIIDEKKTLGERLSHNYEDEREKRKVNIFSTKFHQIFNN